MRRTWHLEEGEQEVLGTDGDVARGGGLVLGSLKCALGALGQAEQGAASVRRGARTGGGGEERPDGALERLGGEAVQGKEVGSAPFGDGGEAGEQVLLVDGD